MYFPVSLAALDFKQDIINPGLFLHIQYHRGHILQMKKKSILSPEEKDKGNISYHLKHCVKQVRD